MTAHAAWLAGEQACERKDFAAAEAHYRRALALAPGHAPALVGLSTALTQRGRHREAHEAAVAAFEHRPQKIPPILYAIAQRLRYFHEFERLVECLRAPAFVQGAPVDVLARAAVMLSSIGAHEEALAMAHAGVAREPANAAILHVLGNFLLFRGEIDAAEAHYEASLRSDPLLFQNSLTLAGVRTQTTERNHVPRLYEQLAKARRGGHGEIYLYFALHRELHDLQRYDEAWHALERGCQAKRRLIDYRLEDDAALVDALERVCTPAFVAECSEVQQPSVPIFIVGMHRSGTTLLERMLAGHSLIGDAGETSAFHAEMELAVDLAAPQGPNAETVRRAREADFDAVARGYARRARWLSRGKPFFTEKLPQNFLNVGFIAKALPQARFLHLVRDPMDTCFSNLRQLFSGAALYSYDQRELAAFYLLYRRAMAHWRSVLPGRVLDISYERLVAEPDAVAREVALHCGVEFEPGMVDLARPAGAVATPSATLARQGFRRDRGQLWRRYEAHLGPLWEALQPAYAEPVPA